MKNNQSNQALGYVAILFAMLFWGFSFVWIKQLLLNNFPVFTIVFIRLVLASAVFITILKLQKKLQHIERADYKDFLLLAFYEPFLYFIGEDFGLKYVDASFAAVIIALIPSSSLSQCISLRKSLLDGNLSWVRLSPCVACSC